ncbi:MAG: Uma2 family endonuclease [Pseudonocardiaceae bacterium]
MAAPALWSGPGRGTLRQGVRDATPDGFDAGTSIHAYGGGAYAPTPAGLVAVNSDDQRLYRVDHDGTAHPITAPSDDRYGDLRPLDATTLICVRERPGGPNELVMSRCSNSPSAQYSEFVVGTACQGWPARGREGTMRVMSAEPGFAGIAVGRPFTVRDLEAMPDDGHRYELIDGALIVTPAPGWSHQEMVIALAVQLRQECPQQLRVLVAPFAVQPDEDNEVQPDILVARFDDLTPRNLPVAPLLAVEMLSPNTKLIDLNSKKAAYERMGVVSYWVLDPAQPGRLTVFELDDKRRYVEVACVEGDEVSTAERPFPVTIVPARLLDGLRPDTER